MIGVIDSAPLSPAAIGARPASTARPGLTHRAFRLVKRVACFAYDLLTTPP